MRFPRRTPRSEGPEGSPDPHDEDLTRLDDFDPLLDNEGRPIIIGNRYVRGKGFIGHGGMGKITQALDTTTKKVVALKEVSLPANHRLGSSPILLPVSLENEFSAHKQAQQIQSEKVPALYGFVDEDGKQYLIMEYLQESDGWHSGERLALLAGFSEGLDFHITLTIAEQLLLFVDKLAKKQIFHLDLRPANIFFHEQQRIVKLIDWGRAFVGGAKARETDPKNHIISGSPRFMAPERLRGREQNTLESELYSVALIIYDFLCGGLAPVQEGKKEEIFARASGTGQWENPIKRDSPALSNLTEEELDRLDLVFQKALHEDPKKRYRSGKEFYSALYSVYKRHL